MKFSNILKGQTVYMLQVDGGGIKGVIPSVYLRQIQRHINKKYSSNRPIGQRFHMISGTSTGGILGICLANSVSGKKSSQLYLDKGPRLFKARNILLPWNWGKAKYDRQPIMNEIKASIGMGKTFMKDVDTDFMCTSVSLVDQRTHYFKSWQAKDGQQKIMDVIPRTFAAAFYFGKIVDQVNKQVWADGGQGRDNCTLRQCIIQSIVSRLLTQGHPIKILSIGCGYVRNKNTFQSQKGIGLIGQTTRYLNLARRQATDDQVYQANVLCQSLPVSLRVMRLDLQIAQSQDALDAVQYTKVWQQGVMKTLQRKPQIFAKVQQFLSK